MFLIMSSHNLELIYKKQFSLYSISTLLSYLEPLFRNAPFEAISIVI